MDNKKNALGVEQNVAGVLCYVLGFISGLIIFLLEKDNKFIRFHAMQSIIVFGALFVISLIPFLGWIASFVLAPIAFILWVILMIKAYQGEMFKLPVVGDIAAKQAEKIKI